MIHEGRRERMKQRFIHDLGRGFADHEILEVLLYYAIPQKDTNVLAHQLIAHFSSLHGVLEADYEDLIKIDGIGKHAAVLLKIVLPVYSQYMKSKLGEKTPLQTQEQLARYCAWLLRHEKNETFFTICLDQDYNLIASVQIATGSINEVKTYPRHIVSAAIKHNASFIVLCHNHSSVHCEPSAEDEENTILIDKIVSALDIPLLDHIIVATPYVYSMKHRTKKQYDNKEIT